MTITKTKANVSMTKKVVKRLLLPAVIWERETERMKLRPSKIVLFLILIHDRIQTFEQSVLLWYRFHTKSPDLEILCAREALNFARITSYYRLPHRFQGCKGHLHLIIVIL